MHCLPRRCTLSKTSCQRIAKASCYVAAEQQGGPHALRQAPRPHDDGRQAQVFRRHGCRRPSGGDTDSPSAPTPLGPYSLCALMDMRSTFMSSTLTGTLPTACAASVWKNTLRARHMAPISFIGWMTPVAAACTCRLGAWQCSISCYAYDWRVIRSQNKAKRIRSATVAPGSRPVSTIM